MSLKLWLVTRLCPERKDYPYLPMGPLVKAVGLGQELHKGSSSVCVSHGQPQALNQRFSTCGSSTPVYQIFAI